MDKQRRKALVLYHAALKRQKLLIMLLWRSVKERERERAMFKTRATEGAFHTLVHRHLEVDEQKFREYFRLTKDEFDYILGLIEDDVRKKPTNRVPNSITPKEKLAITLRFLGAGESFRSLQFYYRISHSYISIFVPEVLDAIIKHVVPIYLPPPSDINWEEKAEEFWRVWNFPNLIAAIDGKHVRIVNPDDCGSLYFNYKHFFSIVLLAMVDANYKFLVVDIGSYGKEGDSGIFDKSKTGQQVYTDTFNFPPPKPLPGCTEPMVHVICGDEAFRLSRRVMKPYPKDQSKNDSKKTIFNYRLSRARRVTENAFGILCAVFRIFFTPINVKAKTVDKIILACCALHNMKRDNAQKTRAEEDFLPEFPTQNIISIAATGGFQDMGGFQVREIFTEFFDGIGAVPWQQEYTN